MSIKITESKISYNKFKRIIKDKNTINLLSKEQTRRLGNKIRFGEKDRKQRREEDNKNKKSIIGSFFLFGLLILLLISFFTREVKVKELQIEQQKVVLGTKVAKTIIEPLRNDLNESEEHIESIENKAFEFIIQFEWFHDKPYWDYKQWSCWYGMKCSKDTKNITKEKSKEFVIERIRNIREKYSLSQYKEGLDIALTSFIYNIWRPPIWYTRYINNNHINWLKNMMRKYSYAEGKYLRGLNKRRVSETSLF